MPIERERGTHGKIFLESCPEAQRGATELAARASSSSPHEEQFPFFTEADSTTLK